MPYGFEPQKIERFGGLSTLVDPTNLPNYASPDCSDVEFLPGLVRTRPGTTSVFAALGGNPTVNYLKTYITPTVLLRALVLDSLGNFYKENPIGTLALIGQIENSGAYGNSVSLFGREYIAFGDGKIGIAIPRQFDDVNFDRVSQVGPGQAPSATDENQSATIAAVGVPGAQQPFVQGIIAGPNGAIESGNLVTITTAGPHGLLPGINVTIAGVGVAGYNGTFVVVSVLSLTVFTVVNGTAGLAASGGGTESSAIAVFTTTTPHTFVPGQLITIAGVAVGGYNGTYNIFGVTATQFEANIAVGGLANSGGGTATAVGNIIAGKHLFSVVFVTRNGYITAPAPFAAWTSSGGKRVILANIPIGPPDVVQRIVIFTASGGQSFFYTASPSVVDFTTIVAGGNPIFSSNMIINDNTTTTAAFDFSDATLLEGTNADALFELVELGECSGVTQYSSRLFWWGERNKIENFLNLTFDGGFNNPGSTPSFPLGWDPDITSSAGGNSAIFQGQPVIFGDAYAIKGDGATVTRGKITQGAYQDSFGDQLIDVNTAYSVRARIAKNVTLVAGTLHINLSSASGAFTTTGISLAANAVTTSYQEFIATIITSQASIPADLVLQIYADGTPTNNGMFLVENVEIFPTNVPTNTTTVRASKIEDPESYDGVTGFLDVAPSNGQAVRAGFVIRNNLYFAKERSLYVTQDDGVNEPNQWQIQEVSLKVGTLSVRGVGLGDEWAIIAGQDGVYYFDGGEPQKISQEIQPTWDSINWSLGYLIDVKVDTKRKRVYIAVPLGPSATANNKILTLDYTDGFGDPTPTNTVNIAGIGRKWSPWAIACNSMNLILRSDGTQQLWFGNGTGIGLATGKIYQLDTTGTVFSDDTFAVLASDNFNRANQNPILAPWITLGLPSYVAGQILGNQYTGTGVGSGDVLYDGGITWPNDQFSQATLKALVVGSGDAVLWVRGNLGNGVTDGNSYAFELDAKTTGGIGASTPAKLIVQIGNTQNIVANTVVIPQIGDVFKFSVSGQTITVLQNGVLILQATDSQVASGKPGVGSEPNVAGQIAWDDWSAGATNGGGAINSYWQSGYFQDVGRLVFGPLVANVVGAGACNLILRKGDQGWVTNLRSWTLSPLGFHNMERTLNIETERLAVRFGTNAVGAHFSLQGLSLYAKAATWAELRGINA